MASKQEVLRERIVRFYESNINLGKKYTVNHFRAESIPERTIYNILSKMQVKRTVGTGRKAEIMTNRNIASLKKLFNNKDSISQRDAARKYNCSRQYVSKVLKKCGIVARHKQRSPNYTDEQISLVKSQCRWMTQNYRGKSYVLDDESYFGLSRSQTPGNNIFYTNDISNTPNNVKYKFKAKFEPKVMLYIVISEKGVSKPYFKPSGIAINQEIYQNECLKKVLVPFLKTHHADNKIYNFGPIKRLRITKKNVGVS